MDVYSMDHYEKRLYEVFRGFAIGDTEILDVPALTDLCASLQLEEKGAQLAERLFQHSTEQVTFTRFRDALLAVLGAEPSSPDSVNARDCSPKHMYGSKKYGRRSKPHDVLESAGDDVPPSMTEETHDITTENKRRKAHVSKSRKALTVSPINQTECLQASSAMEELADMLDHTHAVDVEKAVELCQQLQMDKIDINLIKFIFKERCDEGSIGDMTVGEFFHRLNSKLTSSVVTMGEESPFTVDADGVLRTAPVNISQVLCVWNAAGIHSGQKLLRELGFSGVILDVAELITALDEEVKAIESNKSSSCQAYGRTLLMLASLSLHQYELMQVKRYVGQVFSENIKIKNDLADANKRAQTLAQEVDENHAKMEQSLLTRIKLLENKHIEALKAASNEWRLEKERMAIALADLEERALRSTSEEARLRSEHASLQLGAEELQRRATAAEERAADLEVIRTQLTRDLKTLAAERGPVKDHLVADEEVEVDRLSTVIEELRLENKGLRDRNDELCAEVETLTDKWGHEKRRAALARSAPHSLDISSEQAALAWCEEADGATASERPVKRRGDSPSHTATTATSCEEDSPRVRKLRKKLNAGDECLGRLADELNSTDFSDEASSLGSLDPLQNIFILDKKIVPSNIVNTHIQNFISLLKILKEKLKDLQDVEAKTCESCDTLKGIYSVIHNHLEQAVNNISADLKTTEEATQTDSVEESESLEVVTKQLEAVRSEHSDELTKLTDRCRDLESSLEQMKAEFDKSEEYWQNKLEEERDIFTEEQKASDERFSELVMKISEYEQQFVPKSNTLPTIDEKYSLELQFIDLEEEFEQYKLDKTKELEDKTAEIDRLKNLIAQTDKNTSKQALHISSRDEGDGKANESLSPGVSSPIDYLWTQGTIQAPFSSNSRGDNVRDYTNPAFTRLDSSVGQKAEEKPAQQRPSSDGEREVNASSVTPIQKPAFNVRSKSVDLSEATHHTPPIIHCSELERDLRRNSQQTLAAAAWAESRRRNAEMACVALEQRCSQLQAALHRHQLHLDSVQQSARSENHMLRQKLFNAEAAIGKLQQRLASADLLVKELYVENCQLARCAPQPKLL